MPSTEQIREQSINAYSQWCDKWREHARIHSKYKQLPLTDLENSGIGRAILVVANGYSLEENMETIKKNQDKVDIFCCDKTLGHLLDHGIKPKYCMVCDASVSTEYLEPWKDQLDETILLINVCGNYKWTDMGNWKKNYFFVNEDVMNYEKEFSALSGSNNFIPAGTNVSNAMVVMLTQSNNNGRNNFFGYDKILLIGFDYCWRPQKYYAYDELGKGKDNYMRHQYLVDAAGDYVYTSGNLMFSAQWLSKYATTFKLPTVQCSRHTICDVGNFGKLEEQMQYEHKPEHQTLVKSAIEKKNKLAMELSQVDNVLKKLVMEHHYSFVGSI